MKNKVEIVHSQEVTGDQESCDFEISDKNILLGHYYYVQVVAIKDQMENPSGKEELLFGESFYLFFWC